MPDCLIASLLLLALLAVPARADDWEDCTTLSFAPLDRTIPACDRLLDSGTLSNDRRIDALLARAEAFLFAQTYHRGHSVDRRELLQRALTDLNRAEMVARRLPAADHRQLVRIMRERGSVLHQLGRFHEAVQDYTAIFKMSGRTDPSTLLARALSYKEMGKFDDAIADLNEVVRVTGGARNQHNWIFLRGQVYEAAGNREAAIADYRQTLSLQADHGGAAEALKRLGAGP